MTTTTKNKPADGSDEAMAIDGYTWAEIEAMVHDATVVARCVYCQHELEIEPDARGYDCHECGGAETITSPLIKLGLV